MDQKTMVHLHNGILCSRKKEGVSTLCDSMDGSGETLLFKRNTLKIERGRGTD